MSGSCHCKPEFCNFSVAQKRWALHCARFILHFCLLFLLTAMTKKQAAWTAVTHDPLRGTFLGLVMKSMLLLISLVRILTFSRSVLSFHCAFLQSHLFLPVGFLSGYLYFFRENLRYEYSYTYRKVYRILRTNSILNCWCLTTHVIEPRRKQHM